jgi:nucleotide-binding universal stress UspA family protein/GNAT superfamily N-acetyltransferase
VVESTTAADDALPGPFGRSPVPFARRIRSVKLRDGSRVKLRPISAEDKALVAAAFDRLSDESRYRRYFTHVETLTPEMLAYLTEVDHVDHEAIIAIEPTAGDAVGVARFIRTSEDPEAADVALAVVDDWHGRGLGRALLTALTRRARQEGVRRFVAVVLYDNERAIQLLRGVSELQREALGPEMRLAAELPEKRGIGMQLAGVLRAAAAGTLGGREVMVTALSRRARTARAWRSVRTVIVGSDGSPTATVVVQAAADIASRFDAALHVVSAYRSAEQRPEALMALSAAEDEIRGAGLVPRCHAREGEAANVLAEVAEEHDADVIVVGSKGMSGAARLVGSVPNTVSHSASCSVLIVRTV